MHHLPHRILVWNLPLHRDGDRDGNFRECVRTYPNAKLLYWDNRLKDCGAIEPKTSSSVNKFKLLACRCAEAAPCLAKLFDNMQNSIEE